MLPRLDRVPVRSTADQARGDRPDEIRLVDRDRLPRLGRCLTGGRSRRRSLPGAGRADPQGALPPVPSGEGTEGGSRPLGSLGRDRRAGRRLGGRAGQARGEPTLRGHLRRQADDAEVGRPTQRRAGRGDPGVDRRGRAHWPDGEVLKAEPTDWWSLRPIVRPARPRRRPEAGSGRRSMRSSSPASARRGSRPRPRPTAGP